MSQEGPKLYVNKPKKVQVIKHLREMEAQSSPSTPSSSTPSMGAANNGGASKPPPEVPRESFARRYKFLWPLLLTVNLAVGAYLFMRTKKKDVDIEEETTSAAPSIPTSSTTPTTAVSERPVAQPVRVLEPIPEQQQRELYKWMLEERRKIKTKDPEEKKRIDGEKAILKQFIRAKSIPSI